MATTLLNKAGVKLLQKHLEQYTPVDPLYEEYTDSRGRKKRRKRELPPGLSARDAKILKSVKRRAHYLDKGFHLCGLRFGWTFFIGLIPGAGDVADASLNYLLVVRKARQAEIPPWLLRHMLTNNVISAATGFIPVAGAVIIASFKANSRNAALLEEYLRIRGEEFLRLQEEGKRVTAGGAVVKDRQGVLGGTSTVVKDNTRGEVAKGVPRANVEQTKPGSGVGAGEVVPGAPSGSGSDGTPDSNGSNGARKRSFISWGKKGKGRAADVGERGRFVEDVPSGSGSGSGSDVVAAKK